MTTQLMLQDEPDLLKTYDIRLSHITWSTNPSLLRTMALAIEVRVCLIQALVESSSCGRPNRMLKLASFNVFGDDNVRTDDRKT